ncbi:MFS transporter [Gordonia alkaliphila]|uniref:MFS transporter n=1 Tax=Gordonia alkaliphila TaxID=1053547 RepID=UPI001FF38D0E|nr:MFS transporter [Gordonia alkaliphila]MCK0440200.1 MFS transporter [Gordonia alkaliphila]
MTAPTLSRGTSLGYAAGSVGTGTFGVLPGLVLAYYLTDTLGVGPLLASFVVVFPKIIDVMINPMVGARSDRDFGTTGRRTRLMWWGAITIVPLFIATFATPTSLSSGGAALWVLIFFSLTAVAYALFQVPYIALPADLTTDYHGRTKLISDRIVVLALTILVVGAGAPAIRNAFDGGFRGYLAMAVATTALMALGMAAATHWAGRAGATAVDPTIPLATSRTRDGFEALKHNHHYRILLLVYVMQALATAVMLAGAQYVATYILEDKDALTPLFIALVAPAILIMPLWVRIGGRFGKQRALAAASVLFMLAAASLGAAIVTPGVWIYASVAVAGIGYAGMQTFPLAMLPDVIDEQSAAVGRDQGGALSGLWTASETMGLAIGPGLYLLVLAAAGFRSSTGDEVVVQTDGALTGITVGFALVPAALIAVSLVILSRYRRSEQPA